MRLCDNDSLAWNQLVELYGPLTPACAGLTWNFAAKNQNLIAKYNLGLALSNYGQLLLLAIMVKLLNLADLENVFSETEAFDWSALLYTTRIFQ